MVTQYEFNLLPVTEKADVLWRYGTYLLTRDAPPFLVKLYALGDFFVEAYFMRSSYQPESHDFQDLLTFRQQDLQTIRRPHPLEPYLDQVDLRTVLYS